MSPPALADLRDIHLPPPPFPASLANEWALAAAALLLLAAAGWIWRHRRRRRLRAALRELARLAAAHARDGEMPRLAAGLSRLLRDYAVMRFPQARVAGLTDAGWLEFLDANGGAGAFSNGAGAALAWLPYSREGEADAAALVAAVRRWLEANPQ